MKAYLIQATGDTCLTLMRSQCLCLKENRGYTVITGGVQSKYVSFLVWVRLWYTRQFKKKEEEEKGKKVSSAGTQKWNETIWHLAEQMVVWLYGVGDMLMSLNNLNWHDLGEDEILRNIAMVHY